IRSPSTPIAVPGEAPGLRNLGPAYAMKLVSMVVAFEMRDLGSPVVVNLKNWLLLESVHQAEGSTFDVVAEGCVMHGRDISLVECCVHVRQPAFFRLRGDRKRRVTHP